MLPTVDFCGLNATRLIIGANPQGGFSHQGDERDREMVEYYTRDRILETWDRAAKAGINTFITNNETPHVIEAVQEYLSGDPKLQWICQVSTRQENDMLKAIDGAVEIGAKALYIHGGKMDDTYKEGGQEKEVEKWVEHAKSYNIPVGSAGHSPKTHYWLNDMDILDFHVVSFFNCGSLHFGAGHKFSLADAPVNSQITQDIKKPCIGYKIMAAGRIEAEMAFEYAFSRIKDTDCVNVGMYRGDNDTMVEDNVKMVEEILSSTE